MLIQMHRHRTDTDRDGWIQVNYEQFMAVSIILYLSPLSLSSWEHFQMYLQVP